MSEAYYPTRLMWYGDSGGVAKLDGRRMPLFAAPQLPGCPLRVVAIDYAPRVVAQVMPYGEKMRDMTPEECSAADALLAQLLPAESWPRPTFT